MSATILLADDSPTIQKVVELTFAETPHQVVAVSSGSELLARLPEVKPDVVICDVIMPDRDGYDVCQTIKSSPETLHIPVVLLTGTFEPFDRDRALAVGCDEIVTKPFEARQLIATVERLVSGEAAPAEATPSEKEPEEFGTYLVTPPAAEGGEVEAPPVPPAEAPNAAEGILAAAQTPGEAFPPAGPEVEGEIPEEGLDFTTTGFAEMEAAGEQPHVPMEPPAEGLEIEEPPVELPVEEPAETGEEAPFPAGDEGWEQPQETAGSPSDTAPVSGPAEESWGFGEAEPQPQEAAEEHVVHPPAEAETGAEPEAPAEPAMAGGAEPGIGDQAAAWQKPAAEPEPQPEPPAEPAPGTVTAPMPIPPAASGALSDEDVDRIARRVVELFEDRLEQIAWEVLPDMAEIVVRERVRQLEEEIEAGEG